MSKSEFISRLDYLLSSIPEQDKKEAIEYYLNYFEDAGIENEERVIRELESPEKVAEQILSDFSFSGEPQKEEVKTEKRYRSFWDEHRTISILLIIAIVLLTLPAWGSVLGTALGVICGILGSVVAFSLVGVVLIAVGIMAVVSAFPLSYGMGALLPTLLGAGLLCIALGLLALLATIWLWGRFIPWLFGLVKKAFQGIFRKRENR